jgi:voltage-gated sodium channel
MRNVGTAAGERGSGRIDRFAAACLRIAESPRFQATIIVAILLNAIVIGLETYDSIDDEYGGVLRTLNDVFLGMFTVEVLIRVAAHGRRPLDFFRSGWNVFDFVVVGAAYVPAVRESVTLLRLARVLRVARLLSVIPGLRIVVLGIARSLAQIGGMAALTFFVLYMYGILGWILYADHDPDRFGNIGRALLTLFQILTLEGWNDVLATEMKYSSWSWIYFVSFVLIGTFVVLNVVIAIIVNSMDEVRALELERERKDMVAAALQEGEDDHRLQERLHALRGALDELEQALVDSAGKPGGSGASERPTQ